MGDIGVGIPEPFAPPVVSRGVQLRQGNVPLSRADQRPTTKVDLSTEAPCDEHVATGVHAYTFREVVIRIAEAFAPDVVAGKVELGDEHVVGPRTGQVPAAEVYAPP